MNVIHTSQIFDEVRDQLYSWDALNRVDDSLFYPIIRRILSKLGPEYMEEHSIMLEISGGRAPLPKDFAYLTAVYMCWHNTLQTTDPRLGLITQEVYDIPEQNTFDVHTDDCGRPYRIVQKLPVTTYEWNTFEVLSVVKTVPCSDYCINRRSTSNKKIEIKNGYIYTNFDEGTVYFNYLRPIEDESGYYLPNHPVIIEWIKAELIYETLKVLGLNNVPDMNGAIQLAMITLREKKAEFDVLRKRSSVQEFYNVGNKLIKRYNAMYNGTLRDTRYDRR